MNNKKRLTCAIKPLYYNASFQAAAFAWWRTLSINEMKSLERKYNIAGYMASPSEVAAIYDSVVGDQQP